MVKTIVTFEEKQNLRAIADELAEIRKLVEELAETLVNLSDKELMKRFDASSNDLKENQVDTYKETLEKKLDITKKEMRS